VKPAFFLSHDLSSVEVCVTAIPDPLADSIPSYIGVLNNSAAEAGLSIRSGP